MTNASTLSASIRDHAQRRGIALVPFLTAGWPTRDSFSVLLEQISPHAAAIEIGIPFSDPMADGVTIQRSSREALAQGVTPRWIFNELQRIHTTIAAPLVIMSYLNPLMSLGDELPTLCRDAGVAAIIIPDLPLDEAQPWKAALATHGIGLVNMVTPLTPESRLTRAAAASDGFLYAVMRAGITGAATDQPVLADQNAYLARCRAAANVPVCAGFGVRTPADIHRLTGHCDGAIIGSALVDTIARGSNPAHFLRDLLP